MGLASRLRQAAGALFAPESRAVTPLVTPAQIEALVEKRVRFLSGVDDSRGWVNLFTSEDRPGGWQQDREISQDSLIGYGPVNACVTLIASDIGKICLRLMKQAQNVWVETESPAFTPVLRKPNHFQTRQQFVECWVLSKLLHGNAYILKIRDARKVVVALYVLDPNRVTPLVAPDGSVFYALQRDDLSKLPIDHEAIPASEIIHDRMECLFHPLVGISPLYAAYISATPGMRIQSNAERFFRNHSRPGGMLTAPHTIDDGTAQRLKKEFDKKFKGEGAGSLFVGGDGLVYAPIRETAADSQLVEQLKLSGEQVCSVFHVPPYMVGVGATPSYNNVEALNQQYYTQCLQKLFNAIEDLLDDGLGTLQNGYRTEFDLDDLIRMDSVARATVVEKLKGASIIAPNEGRAKFGYLPVPGGEWPLAQMQDYSLAALGELHQRETAAAAQLPAPEPMPADPADDEAKAALETARLLATFTKGLENAA